MNKNFALLIWLTTVLIPALCFGENAERLPNRVRVLLPACQPSPFNERTVIEILVVELGQSGIDLGGAHAEAQVLVSVDGPNCGGNELTLSIERLATSRTMQQQISLSDIPHPERARVIALAIAELIRNSWIDLGEINADQELPEVVSEPEVHRAEEVENERIAELEQEIENLRNQFSYRLEDIEEALDRVPERSLDAFVHLGLAGGIRLHALSSFAGGRLSGSFRLSRTIPLRLNVGVSFRYSRARHRLGLIQTYAVEGDLGLMFFLASDTFALSTGLGLGFGWAIAQGDAREASTTESSVSDAITTIGFRTEISRRITDLLGLFLMIEVGYTILGITPMASYEALGGVDGAFVTIDLGLFFAI